MLARCLSLRVIMYAREGGEGAVDEGMANSVYGGKHRAVSVSDTKRHGSAPFGHLLLLFDTSETHERYVDILKWRARARAARCCKSGKKLRFIVFMLDICPLTRTDSVGQLCVKKANGRNVIYTSL